MYRILIARNGYYYVQQQTRYGWQKTGGFFHTRRGARTFIRDHRGYLRSTVVEYV